MPERGSDFPIAPEVNKMNLICKIASKPKTLNIKQSGYLLFFILLSVSCANSFPVKQKLAVSQKVAVFLDYQYFNYTNGNDKTIDQSCPQATSTRNLSL